ncbi:hypothetical protein CASFOL_039862 [Castilleja foliolosa]|uniref:Protein Lines N-terminal domain-containing protein n=1 Tax=Castilleja foliolosa TaxID=1961234 RepID=A0ABD3BI44_9LAMI
MSPRPEYLRLRLLLDEFLQPFSDIAADSVTEEIEKDLLIALSQVFRQVKQWTLDFDSDEYYQQELSAVDDCECSDDRHFLHKIIGDLMFFLALNNRYAQHLTGNILVAISEFLLTSDIGWDDGFMHLLSLCLELAIRSSLKTRYLDSEPTSTSTLLLKSKLKNAKWFAVAAIFRVLRNIQKYMNQESDYKIMKTYLESVSSLMINSDLLKDAFLQMELVKSNEITMFFGNFIQFLCSLVAKSSFLDDGAGFSQVIRNIIDLVPKLVACCHIELQSPCHVRISHYFRHKVLMLMVKLSSNIHFEKTIHMTWIDLVHKYFEDLLLQPIISEGKFDNDDFLEGSPFCTSISDPAKQKTSFRHLRRLTVFLFLKCSLNSIHTNNCNVDLKLHEWLRAHIEADVFENDEFYFDRCVGFTLSFVQLFMHEDDILFEMLLQLFHVPFYSDRQIIIKDEPLAEAKTHLSFLVSDLFNPIHLCHIFLSEIHYDHQVLLDYLISKDTGSSCAEYLLRSLRIVCDSWNLFSEFPGVEKDRLGRLCPKRQKVSDYKEPNEGCKNNRLPFVSARDCLVSLKTSIDSLNQKNLFPYNPKVLLRR